MKRDIIYLEHILDAAEKIMQYSAVGHDTFLAETHWQDAIVRQLEIMGEATKHLSDEIRSRYPELPWRRIAGLRDVLIHDYMGVDPEIVWAITVMRSQNCMFRSEG
ncbi:MAG: DUF86 domain-containing protein [Chloroflexi bacterium]|nr:DUF86 domain-containing protein [Chloroflexota bacterium]